jgi:diguanylate cyclase (GGDEF)-like protein
MKWFSTKKPQGQDMTPEELREELQLTQERSEFLHAATLAFIMCVKEFALGRDELKADAFMDRMDELKKAILAGQSTPTLVKRFVGYPEMVLDFVAREKAYYAEREAEFTTIIQMLRTGLASVFDDNQAFTQSVAERGLRLERLSNLDDIRRIREQLKGEVDALQTTIKEKKTSDMRRMEKLTRQVDALRVDLEKVKDVSKMDALTSAFNRMAFDTHMQHLIDRANQLPSFRFCLLMCDLDNFKGINDTYGHPVGDRVLLSFVRECKAYFRDRDFVARYGGEEFAIILPDAQLADAMKRADRLCNGLAEKRFRIDDNTPDKTIGFTVSIGVSAVRPEDSKETLIERADRALYVAKRTGKSRAVSEEEVRATA